MFRNYCWHKHTHSTTTHTHIHTAVPLASSWPAPSWPQHRPSQSYQGGVGLLAGNYQPFPIKKNHRIGIKTQRYLSFSFTSNAHIVLFQHHAIPDQPKSSMVDRYISSPDNRHHIPFNCKKTKNIKSASNSYSIPQKWSRLWIYFALGLM